MAANIPQLRATEESTLADPDGAPVSCLIPEGCTWPVVLGIDPGTLVMCYGALVLAPDGPRLLVAGTVRPRAADPVPQRLSYIRREMDDLMRACRPAHVAVERVYAGRNVQSALRIGEGRGVVLAAAAAASAEVAEIAPAEAKKAVLGNGGASKEQVAAMVRRLLDLELTDAPLDVTDALAVALALVRRLEWGQKSGRRGPPRA